MSRGDLILTFTFFWAPSTLTFHIDCFWLFHVKMPTTGSKLKYFEDISCKKWHASSQNIGHLQEKDAVWWEQIQENLDWHWWTSPSLSVEGKLAFFSSSMEASLSSSIYFFIFYRTRVWSLAMLVTNSLTDWLTHSCLVNLIDVTLAFEDANSKLVEVDTVADVDDEDRIGNSLL